MVCDGCGNQVAAKLKFKCNDEGVLICKCDKCGNFGGTVNVPDVYWPGHRYFDQNLGNEKFPYGQWIESKQHKQKIMREQNLVEKGDRVKGSRVKYEPGYGMRKFQ